MDIRTCCQSQIRAANPTRTAAFRWTSAVFAQFRKSWERQEVSTTSKPPPSCQQAHPKPRCHRSGSEKLQPPTAAIAVIHDQPHPRSETDTRRAPDRISSSGTCRQCPSSHRRNHCTDCRSRPSGECQTVKRQQDLQAYPVRRGGPVGAHRDRKLGGWGCPARRPLEAPGRWPARPAAPAAPPPPDRAAPPSTAAPTSAAQPAGPRRATAAAQPQVDRIRCIMLTRHILPSRHSLSG